MATATEKKVSVNLTPIVTGGVVVAVALALYLLYRWNKNRDANKYLKTTNKEIIKSQLSFQDTDYSNMANALLGAMKGLGTDEDTIYSVFNRMETESDVRKLVASFGLQNGKTLQQWLLSELSKTEQAKLNALLETKGINYTF